MIEEMLDVYLEEADEVPRQHRLRAAAMVASDRTTAKRSPSIAAAYHTLKGSGRMVGLNDLGRSRGRSSRS